MSPTHGSLQRHIGTLFSPVYIQYPDQKKASNTQYEKKPFILLNNQPPPQLLNQFDYKLFLQEHEISEYFFEPRELVDQQIPFASQIHIYQALARLSLVMGEDDLLILLDCDVFCQRLPSDHQFSLINDRGYSWFPQGWPKDYSVNGVSRERIIDIFHLEWKSRIHL